MDRLCVRILVHRSPTGISASARLSGQVTGKNSAGGSGVTNVWVMWHDSLTFHSKQIPTINPDDFRRGRPPTPADLANSAIKVKLRLLQNPPQCSGETHEFTYKTGVYAIGISGMSNGGVGGIAPPGGIPPKSNKDNWYIRADKCGIPSDTGDVQAINGQEMAIHITVNEQTDANLDFHKSPEGHLKVELSGIRLCVIRPKEPSDLTLTAASGADYWCPAGGGVAR